mgnify:CR=1 FL=1
MKTIFLDTGYIMEQFNIETAFAFDKHFVQAGFEKAPEL